MINSAEERVVLVDAEDRMIGTMNKIEAHEKGILHRAFSVFIFNSDGHWLLQRRASSKYHSPDLWSNTCCSHPREGEEIINSAIRRLKEEMGLYCQLRHQFHFSYRCQLPNGLIENELDHVLLGYSDTLPTCNEEEVSEFRYFTTQDLEESLKSHPEWFSVWFKLSFHQVKHRFSELRRHA